MLLMKGTLSRLVGKGALTFDVPRDSVTLIVILSLESAEREISLQNQSKYTALYI